MLLCILLIKKRYLHWVMKRPTLKSERFQYFKISFRSKLAFWNMSLQKVFLVVSKHYAIQNMYLLQYLSHRWTFRNYYCEKESKWIMFLFLETPIYPPGVHYFGHASFLHRKLLFFYTNRSSIYTTFISPHQRNVMWNMKINDFLKLFLWDAYKHAELQRDG